jgi:hypothetical protein
MYTKVNGNMSTTVAGNNYLLNELGGTTINLANNMIYTLGGNEIITTGLLDANISTSAIGLDVFEGYKFEINGNKVENHKSFFKWTESNHFEETGGDHSINIFGTYCHNVSENYISSSEKSYTVRGLEGLFLNSPKSIFISSPNGAITSSSKSINHTSAENIYYNAVNGKASITMSSQGLILKFGNKCISLNDEDISIGIEDGANITINDMGIKLTKGTTGIDINAAQEQVTIGPTVNQGVPVAGPSIPLVADLGQLEKAKTQITELQAKLSSLMAQLSSAKWYEKSSAVIDRVKIPAEAGA